MISQMSLDFTLWKTFFALQFDCSNFLLKIYNHVGWTSVIQKKLNLDPHRSSIEIFDMFSNLCQCDPNLIYHEKLQNGLCSCIFWSNLWHTMKYRLRTPGEEIAFTARPKIKSQSQMFRYGQSIFCLPHRPKISDFFDLCLHWVSVVRAMKCMN
jgi:hypothetical protein